MKLLELGWFTAISADIDHTNELIRILDAGLAYVQFTPYILAV